MRGCCRSQERVQNGQSGNKSSSIEMQICEQQHKGGTSKAQGLSAREYKRKVSGLNNQAKRIGSFTDEGQIKKFKRWNEFQYWTQI